MKKILWATTFMLILAVTAGAEQSVTVYNGNLGVIRDTRTLEFQKGLGSVSFVDVPALIDATSVGFKVVDKGKEVVILEQNYAYDLVSPEKIYKKYIDKEIDVIDKEGKIFSGALLSYSGGSLVLRDKAGKIQMIQMGQVTNADFPELPDGLITRPTLFWLYSSDFSGTARCDVSYQTSGLNWTAEYVGVLSADETSLNLNGWASITNNSGATYNDATLKLVAGDIHRATPPAPIRGGREKMVMSMEAPDMDASFQEKEFFEYHLYTLPRKATLANSEIKQISLFEPASTSVKKEFYFEPDKNAEKIRVALKFLNSEKTGLGMPMPAGRTRVFQADDDGSMVLLGEDRIDHTPRNEDVKLTIGYAFDIAAEFQVADFSRISERAEENNYKIELRNRKKEDVTIIVEKKLYGDWEMRTSNFQHTKKDAQTVLFEIPVKADSVSSLEFRVRTTY